MSNPLNLLSDECGWCGTGRLVVPDDDRCRCCIEDGIEPAIEPLQCGVPAVDGVLRDMFADARSQVRQNYRNRNNPFYQLLNTVNAARDQR